MTLDPLAIDLYAGDGLMDLPALAKHPEWNLVMLKLTQGLHYDGGQWLEIMWPKARETERYGETWFRTGYVYLDFACDGTAQADYALKRLDEVGGIGHGDINLVVDVERGGQRVPLTAERVCEVTMACVEKLKSATGLVPVCYGGELLRSLGIKIQQFGCSEAWVAMYGFTLWPKYYESLGCDLEHLFAWQYAGAVGDGKVEAQLRNYPHTSPVGPSDISAITIPGGVANLKARCVSEGK